MFFKAINAIDDSSVPSFVKILKDSSLFSSAEEEEGALGTMLGVAGSSDVFAYDLSGSYERSNQQKVVLLKYWLTIAGTLSVVIVTSTSSFNLLRLSSTSNSSTGLSTTAAIADIGFDPKSVLN